MRKAGVGLRTPNSGRARVASHALKRALLMGLSCLPKKEESRMHFGCHLCAKTHCSKTKHESKVTNF